MTSSGDFCRFVRMPDGLEKIHSIYMYYLEALLRSFWVGVVAVIVFRIPVMCYRLEGVMPLTDILLVIVVVVVVLVSVFHFSLA